MGTSTAQLVATASESITTVSPSRLEVHQYAQTATIVDIREADERAELGWIAGAVHVPRGLLEFWADPTSPSHHPELDPQATTIVYCGAGQRSVLAVQTLQTLGYRDVACLAGGIQAWKQAGHPVVGHQPWQVDLHATTGHRPATSPTSADPVSTAPTQGDKS